MRPQYRSVDIPVFTVAPDWRAEVVFREIDRTIIREALDLSEERWGTRPRPLYGLRYRTTTLSAGETGYIRRVLELAQAMPVAMPVWQEEIRLTAAVVAGGTALPVTAEDITSGLWSVLKDYAILWASYRRWEIVEINAIEEEQITLLQALEGDWPEETRLIPLLFGKLTRDPHTNLYSEQATYRVDFEERFNGITDQGILETSVTELEVEYPTGCRDSFTCTFDLAEGESAILQISDAADGPWHDHIYATGTASGTKTLRLNNDYRGLAFFRLVDADGTVLRSVTQPEASVIEPPGIEVTNLSVPARPLSATGGFTYPYSSAENQFIAPDDLYIVPRGRLEYASLGDTGWEWDGLPHIVTITGEVGATHKWTRDGTDPTEETVIPSLDGFADNAAVNRPDFGLAIKARSFKDGCQSPMTCYLVDKRINQRAYFDSLGGTAGPAAGFCGLPDDDGSEPGDSCNLLYGSPEGFEDHMVLAYATVPAGSSNGDKLVYRRTLSAFESTYIGSPIWKVSVSLYQHEEASIVRDSNWNSFPPAWTFAYVSLWDETDTTVAGGPDYIHGSGVSITDDGNSVAVASSISDWVLANIPNGTFVERYIGVLELVATLHHDFLLVTDPGYTPPVITPPDPPYVPAITIYGDDFESYSAASAAAMTLSEGTGWELAWVFAAYLTGDFGDDFESYSDGVIDDYEAPAPGDQPTTYEQGDGWDSQWFFYTSARHIVYGDDFDAYADGEAEPFSLGAGDGWTEEAGNGEGFWFLGDYSPGGDDFQSYADGAVSSGTLTQGDSFTLDGWQISDYEQANSTAYQHYKIEVLSNVGDISWMGILEFELYENSGGTNYALASNGGVATESAFDGVGAQPGSAAIDGLFGSTQGWSCNNNNVWPQWLAVQLDQARVITEFKVGSYSTTNQTANRSTKDAVIYGSNDGVAWTALRSIRDQTGWTFGQMRTFKL